MERERTSARTRGGRIAAAGAALTALLVLAAADGFPDAAFSQADLAGSRQSAVLAFTSVRPAHSTGANFSIDFRDPANPGGKPHAVARIVLRFHPGTRFDTAALPRCEASDAQLMLQGAAACPAGSRLASGTLVTDTGSIGGLPREVTNVLTQFNTEDGTVTLAESSNPKTRVVSRAPIEGNVITIDVPPVPGGPPPDPYTAFKHFELNGEAVPGGDPYLLTPPSCPASGRWTNRLTFTYRDGVVERTKSRLPCRGRGDRVEPRIRFRGQPERGCAEHGFLTRVRIRDRSPLRRARFRIDGDRVRSTSRKRFTKYVPAKRLGPGAHRITVRARDAAGNRATRSASFRSCPHHR